MGGINYQIRGSFTLFIDIVTSTNSENSVINRSVLSSLTKGRGTSISALTIHAILNQTKQQNSMKRFMLHILQEKERIVRKKRRHVKKTPYKKQAMRCGKNKPIIAQLI